MRASALGRIDSADGGRIAKKERAMPRSTLDLMALLLAVPVVLVGGCATIKRYGVREDERMLAAAGFRLHRADMAELQEDLPSMPPHQLVSRTKDGNVVYMYADPDNCHCVYVGGGKEYSEYERLRRERQNVPRRLGGSSPSGGAAGGAP